MKKTIAGILLAFCTIALSADAYQTFTGIVDFNTTIKDLADNPKSIDPSRLYLIDGTISSIHVNRSAGAKFQAELEFINSEWIGTESIKTYRIMLVMSKSSFAKLFPDKASQQPRPGQVGPNMRALALVQYSNSDEVAKGEIRKIFTVHEFRILR